MPIISRSAVVSFTVEQMYRLVDDIDAYPQFLPWCDAVQVHSRSTEWVEASMSVAGFGFHQSFTTRNRLTPFSRIDLALVAGPFTRLTGYWEFTSTPNAQCHIALMLDYDYGIGKAALLFAPLFTHAANQLVDAFCQRARVIYAT